jgi:hypothetical protein
MWDWAVWGALVVAICGCIAALVPLLTRTRDLLRDVKRVNSEAVKSLGDLAAKAEVAAAKAERVGGDTEELQESVARLRGSIKQLLILREALVELDEQYGWVRVLL